MSRHFKFSLLVIFILTVGLVLVLGGYGWFLQKQERVLSGVAQPNFPYSDYSQAELNKMYPQYIDYSDVPTKQTPEETHQKFLTALKKKDFTEAVNCCFREGDRERMEAFLDGVYKKGQLPLMISDISEIEKNVINEMQATYIYSGTFKGEKVVNFLTFIKTGQGYWYIESL